MPLLLADFIYTRDCKLNLRKNVDTTQRKGLHPTGFEETLAWDDGLNWFHFRKVGQRYFFFCLSSYTGLPKGR